MTRRVLYVAHPLAPTPDEIAAEPSSIVHRDDAGWIMLAPGERALRRNLDLALLWLAWLRRSFPQDTFVAPWIATVMSLHGDDSPELREAGLVDDCAVVERCDGIVLCGSRISSGMQRERAHGNLHAHGIWCSQVNGWDVWDLTQLDLREPPPDLDQSDNGKSLDVWLHDAINQEEGP